MLLFISAGSRLRREGEREEERGGEERGRGQRKKDARRKQILKVVKGVEINDSTGAIDLK